MNYNIVVEKKGLIEDAYYSKDARCSYFCDGEKISDDVILWNDDHVYSPRNHMKEIEGYVLEDIKAHYSKQRSVFEYYYRKVEKKPFKKPNKEAE